MITVIGNIFGSSGYDNHTRFLANALSKITDVSLQANLQPNWERSVNDAELKMINKQTDNEINLIITNPVYWRINCTAKYQIAYLVWEGLNIPKSFINECLNMDIHKIIVPSEHTRESVINTIDELSEEECKKILEMEKII